MANDERDFNALLAELGADESAKGSEEAEIEVPTGPPARVIAVLNQKGGCGKTTTAVNLACGLARGMGNGKRRVLLVDLDPQAASTIALLGVEAADGPQKAPMVYELLLGTVGIRDIIQQLELPGKKGAAKGTLDILPSHQLASGVELELFTQEFNREGRLIAGLKPVLHSYDFIVIDCPPSLNMLSFNALAAATEVLIPVDPGVFPLTGLRRLVEVVGKARRINSELDILGVVPTRQRKTVLSDSTEEKLRDKFGDRVMTGIPERTAISEAHAAQQDIFSWKPTGPGARAYGRLAMEVVRRG